MALALGQEAGPLPPAIKDIVTKARTTWLKSSEVLTLLLEHAAYGLPVSKEAPRCPGGGLLFLFNRKSVRFFRKDGHEWRKKSDGKSVRETHEKLKIENKEVLNCYYAHSEAQEALQRRSYWLLDGDADVVLVHYLSSHPAAVTPSAVPSAMEDCKQEDLRRNSGSQSNLMALDRKASSNVLASQACSQDSLISARSLDRQPSIGPLHEAPLFCGGTVQTGMTVDAVTLQRRGSSHSDCWQPSTGRLADSLGHGGSSSELTSRASGVRAESPKREVRIALSRAGSAPQEATPATRPAPFSMDPFRQEREAHQRAWGDLKRKERSSAAAAAEDDSLKPAVSLTRVDSDTLKVAPSVSGATSGAEANAESRSVQAGPCPPQLSSRPSSRGHACASSPFLAAAYSGQPLQPRAPSPVQDFMTRHSTGSAPASTPYPSLHPHPHSHPHPSRQRECSSPASLPLGVRGRMPNDRMKRHRSNEPSSGSTGANVPNRVVYPGRVLPLGNEGRAPLQPSQHPLHPSNGGSMHLTGSHAGPSPFQMVGEGPPGSMQFGMDPFCRMAGNSAAAMAAADPTGPQPHLSQFDSLSHDMHALEFMPLDMSHLDIDWAASLSR